MDRINNTDNIEKLKKPANTVFNRSNCISIINCTNLELSFDKGLHRQFC